MQNNNGGLGARLIGGIFGHLRLVSDHWGWMLTALAATIFSVAYWGFMYAPLAYACFSMGMWSYDRYEKYSAIREDMSSYDDGRDHYDMLMEYYGLAVFLFMATAAAAYACAANVGYELYSLPCFAGILLYAWAVLPAEEIRDSLAVRLQKWITRQDKHWNSPSGD